MSQIRPGSGTPAAVLAGSLAVFPLLDVLGMLARTHHSGELQVVADGVEARLWVDGGDLLEHVQTAPDRLFELASLDDAWFTVSSVSPPARHLQGERVALEPLLEQVAPHVAEWQSLMRALPFGAVARMAPVMPAPETQIRSDQWRILSLIGAGRPVHEVVDISEDRPLETLRLIHELAQKELIVVELPPAGARRRSPPPSKGAAVADGSTADAAPGDATTPDAGAPEAATPDAEAPAGARPAAKSEHRPAHADSGRADGEPVAATRATTTPLTAKRPAAVRAVAEAQAPAQGSAQAPAQVAGAAGPPADPPPPPPAPPATATAGGRASAPEARGAAEGDGLGRDGADQPSTSRNPQPPRRPGHHAVAAYMPPPVTPNFWPAPPASATGDHADADSVDAVAVAAVVADAALAAATPDAQRAAGPERSG